MTAPFEFDRRLTDWLEETGAPRTPDYFDELLDRTRRTRQRPAWASLERWLPVQLAIPRQVAVIPRFAWLAILALLILALLALALGVGGHRLPPPLGPAANGLIAIDQNGQLSVRSADGSGMRLLSPNTEVDILPTWSVDGTRLAFYSYPAREGGASCGEGGPPPLCDSPDQPNGSLVVMRPDGSGRQVLAVGVRLASPNHVLSGPTWSHDGTRLAYASTGADDVVEMRVVTLDGAIVFRHVGGGGAPTWSPDDQLLGFTMADGVYVTPLDPVATPRRISHASGFVLGFGGPAWSPDGASVAFFAGSPGSNDVYVVGVDGTGERRVDPTDADEYNPAWSPDGARLAFERVGDGDNDVHFVVVNRDGTDPRQLATPLLAAGPTSWSPDGRYLIGRVIKPDLSDVDSVILVDVAAPDRSKTVVSGGANLGWQRLAP